MANPKYVAVIVTLPEQVDSSNADDVYLQLCAAVAPGISTVVADFTMTAFCESMGARAIRDARDYATGMGVEMRSVIRSGGLLRMFQLMGLDRLLHQYPTLTAALNHELEHSQTG
jgi:anti-anti-sigma factor